MTPLAALLGQCIALTQQRTLDFETKGTRTVNQPTPPTPDVASIARAMAAPFPAEDVKFKPQAVSGSRAMAIAYIDARCVIDRLDDVLGIDGWTDTYRDLPDGCAVCRLSVRVGENWIVKTDVGGPSDQTDPGDRRKAAYSDALKRAAVKLGIGRYLYRLGRQWCDCETYEKNGKQHFKAWKRQPTLPASALPTTPAQPVNGRPVRNTKPMPVLFDGRQVN
jgi:hypothetical protein